MTEVKKRLTLDQIMSAIDEVAQDPEDRDRFKALKMLASAETSSIVLPPPMDESEKIERLARVMKPNGATIVQIAYKRAFPHNLNVEYAEPKLNLDLLTEEDRAIVEKCRTLKMIYRMFPEIKKPGIPVGYPKGQGIEAAQNWARQKAAEILIAREQRRMKAAENRDPGLPNARTESQRPPEETEPEGGPEAA